MPLRQRMGSAASSGEDHPLLDCAGESLALRNLGLILWDRPEGAKRVAKIVVNIVFGLLLSGL